MNVHWIGFRKILINRLMVSRLRELVNAFQEYISSYIFADCVTAGTISQIAQYRKLHSAMIDNFMTQKEMIFGMSSATDRKEYNHINL